MPVHLNFVIPKFDPFNALSDHYIHIAFTWNSWEYLHRELNILHQLNDRYAAVVKVYWNVLETPNQIVEPRETFLGYNNRNVIKRR